MVQLVDITDSEEAIIAREQKIKSKHIRRLNRWLNKEGYDFKIINYSAPGFKGSKEDNERLVRTAKFVADSLQDYVTKHL